MGNVSLEGPVGKGRVTDVSRWPVATAQPVKRTGRVSDRSPEMASKRKRK